MICIPLVNFLNFDDDRQFQSRGNEHVHAPFHVVDAPKINENEDNEVIEFIDKYITCSLPDDIEHPEIYLILLIFLYVCTTTCRKKKGVTCRFNDPWPP